MKILVNIDFKESCDEVLNKAMSIANTHQGEMCLFHIVTSVNCDYIKRAQALAESSPNFADLIVGFSGGINYEILREEAAAVLKKEHAKLLALKRACVASGIKTRAFLMEGNILKAVSFQLEKSNPDLVVIKAEDKTQRHYNKIFGEVGGALLKLSKCPVIVLP